MIAIITMMVVMNRNGMIKLFITKLTMLFSDLSIVITIIIRYYKEIAEIYEADGNTDGAIDSYQQAANLFIGKSNAHLQITYVHVYIHV